MTTQFYLDGRILILMLGAGILGGFVNMAINRTGGSSWKDWAWYVVPGIAAAFLMPLFLQTVSSNLLQNLLQIPPPHYNYFVFFGFCLLAAISSKAFIQALTDKVLQELKDQQQKQGQQIAQAQKTAEKAKTSAEEAALIADTTAQRATPSRVARSVGRASSPGISMGEVSVDPLKDQFGGKAEAGDRRLEAKIEPMSASDNWCRVTLRVISVDPQEKPLSGQVTFHLTPNDVRIVDVDQDGKAEVTFAAREAFSVGATADSDAIQLELNLANAPGALECFRKQADTE